MIYSYDVLGLKSNFKELGAFFKVLPADNYLKHKYCFRKRAFRVLKYDGVTFSVVEQDAFYQDSRINKYAGGIERIYEKIPDRALPIIEDILLEVCKHGGIPVDGVLFGIHLIRITCFNENEGYPVPEGYHQDGYDFVGIVPIETHLACGGIHSIRFGSQDGEEILSERVHVGQCLLLNDKNVYHYASPIFPKFKDVEGFRDTLVFTVKSVNVDQ